MTFRMKARRAGWLLVVAAFAFGLFSAVRPTPAQAYGLVSSRSIKMSSSIDGATGVIYTVGFTTATANTAVGAIAIHFCANDPIIGDTCTAPNGFNDNYATLVMANFSSSAASFPNTGWSVDTTNSKSNTVILKRASTFTPTATSTIGFDLGDGLSAASSMTNPDFSATNPSTTFFARITVYSSTTPSFTDDTTSQATEKTAFDAGGVALSTDTTLSLTAKVQEQLTFCVYTTATCAGGAGNGVINLGDPTNGVLVNTNQNYLDASTHWDLASNALNGVVVRIKGDTLRSGTFTIDPQINAGTCATDSTSTSVEQFGVRIVSYGAGQYNGGATNATTPNSGNPDDYSCIAGSHLWNLTSTNTTYGEPFVRTFGATDKSTSNIEFAAKAANTTEAGVYKSTIQLIATATY